MNTIEFKKRELLGKASKKLANKEITPAVIYSSKGESLNVQITKSEVNHIIKEATSTTIIDGELDGKKVKVVVKDIDRNPLSGIVRHIAFFAIDESEAMIFTIPFNIIGISPAVKNNLGILVKALDAVDVRCKSSDLVDKIDIDISNLEHPGQSITIADIRLPEGMTLPNSDFAHAAIVTITQAQKAEEVVVAPVEGEEIPVEGEEAAEETPAETK
ncbi:50S ribosomal protein L25 [Candidatus Dojkabacteria bacterium]|jgi:large subunit ribosomal protein L25|nr:50S ribosomal protein L25 [Candidatus Dojkabacteria bacterium]